MSTSAAAAAAGPAAPAQRPWPFVPRLPETAAASEVDLPVDKRDERQPGLPKKGTVYKPRLPAEDECEEWLDFIEQQKEFRHDLSKPADTEVRIERHREIATAYHTIGITLLERALAYDNDATLLREARKCFEQDYCISSGALGKDDTIAALRKLTTCYQKERNFRAAIQHCEQALTVAVKSKHLYEERQAAYLELGHVCLDWLDCRNDQAQGGFQERQQLCLQMLTYYRRAHSLASSLPTSGRGAVTPTSKRLLLRRAKQALVTALGQKLDLQAREQRERRREKEIERERVETPEECLAEVKTEHSAAASQPQTELFALHSQRVYHAHPLPPPSEAASVKRECLALLSDAEKLAMWLDEERREREAGKDAGELLPPLPGGRYEIDSDEGALLLRDRFGLTWMDAKALTDLRHTRAQMYESVGLNEKALEEYRFVVRRLNPYVHKPSPGQKSSVHLTCSEWNQLVFAQGDALKNSALVALRLGKYPLASRFARQLLVLIQRGRTRFPAENGDPEEPENGREFHAYANDWKHLARLVESSGKLAEGLDAVEKEMKAVSDTAVNSLYELTARLSLLRRKRDYLHRFLSHQRESQHASGSAAASKVSQSHAEFFGPQMQQKANVEREIVKREREVRRKLLEHQSNSAAGGAPSAAAAGSDPSRLIASSLRSEMLTWISLAWSVTDICHLHLAHSPRRDGERAMAEKYWRIVIGLLERHFEKDEPERLALAYQNFADALSVLYAPPAQILSARKEAFLRLESLSRSNSLVYKKTLEVRSELAENIAAALEALPDKTQPFEAATWASQAKALQAECEAFFAASSSPDAVTASMQQWTVNRVQQVFEGEIGWNAAPTEGVLPQEDAAEDSDDEQEQQQKEDEEMSDSTSVVQPEIRLASSAAPPQPSVVPPPPRRRVSFENAMDTSMDHDARPAAAAGGSRSISLAPASSSSHSKPRSNQSALKPKQQQSIASSSRPRSSATISAPSRSFSRLIPPSGSSGSGAGAAAAERRRKRRRIQESSQSADEEEEDEEWRRIVAAGSAPAGAGEEDEQEEKLMDTSEPRRVGPISSAPVRSSPAPAVAVPASSAHPPIVPPCRPLVASAPAPPRVINPALPISVEITGLDKPERVLEELRKLREGKVLEGLQELKITACAFDEAVATELSALFTSSADVIPSPPLTLLRALDLSGTRFDSDVNPNAHLGWSSILLSLPRLPSLQSLDLSCTVVGDWCSAHLLRAVNKSPGLRALRMDDCAQMIGAERSKTIAALTAQPLLQELSLRGCALMPTALTELLHICSEGLPALRVLDLSYLRCMSRAYKFIPTLSGDACGPAVTEEDDSSFLVSPGRSSEASMRAGWLARRSGEKAIELGWSQMERIDAVMEALVQLGTSVKRPTGMRETIEIRLSGWTNVSGSMVQTITRMLTSTLCCVSALELLDSEFSLPEIQQLASALTSNSVHSRSLKSLRIAPWRQRPGSSRVEERESEMQRIWKQAESGLKEVQVAFK